MINSDGYFHRERYISRVDSDQFLIILAFVIYVIGAHLRLSIYSSGNIVVPMYFMIFSSAFLGILKLKKFLQKTLISVLLLAIFVLSQPLLSGGDSVFSASSFQLFASTMGAFAVLFALRDIDRDKLRTTLIYIWFIFIILAFLENLFLKSFFETVRELIYAGSGRSIYAETERDIAIYGKVRATVFASEPSFLADTLSALAVMVFMLSDNRKKSTVWRYFTLMMLASFYIMPSFKLVFYFIAVVVWFFWPKNIKEFIYLIILVVVIFSVLLISSNIFLAIIFSIFESHLTTGSFFGRIGSAHIVGVNALSMYPFFGYGIGNSDQVYDIIVAVWNRTGAFDSFEYFQNLGSKELMSNGFWWMWIYLGIGGVVIFMLIVIGILKSIGNVAPWKSMISASIVWYAGSAFIDPHSWFMVVVFSLGTIGAVGVAKQADLLHKA